MPPADTTASFGYWIRRQRMALDLTQARLARQVGCATVTISKIERDERRPSRQMAGLLADNLAIHDDERRQFLAAALGEQATDRISLTHQPLESPAQESQLRRLSKIPVSPTPFIGRRQELADLSAQLEDPACRLLTLVGLGGFGKTRLAMRLGELSLEKSELFADGVFFVALDGLADGELVTPAIAAALQFAFQEQQDETDQLLSYLANKQLLLILDNADQILVGDSIEAILARASQVKILATSREALNFQQEWFHPLDGLDTMEPDEMEVDGTLSGARRVRSRMRFSCFSSLHAVQTPDSAWRVTACMWSRFADLSMARPWASSLLPRG